MSGEVAMIFAALNVFLALGVGAKSVLARFWIGALVAVALTYLNLAFGALAFQPEEPWPGLRHLGDITPPLPSFVMVGLPLLTGAAGAALRHGREAPRLKEASHLFILLAAVFGVELLLALLVD